MTFVKPNKTKISTPNDKVMTKDGSAQLIINYLKPQFKLNQTFLEPCAGTNAIFSCLPEPRYRCEITDGLDFFEHKNKVDWIITNPPFSIFDDFLIHSFSLANDIVFFCPLNKVFKSKKIDQKILEYGGIKEVVNMGTGGQHGFPFGFVVGLIHYQRLYNGDIKYTRTY